MTEESDSLSLRRWWAAQGTLASSRLLQTEALRATRRLGIDDSELTAALDKVTLVLPTEATFLLAGKLAPGALRSRDALHVATALTLGSDLEGIVTYDVRMIDAAQSNDVSVVSPGRVS